MQRHLLIPLMLSLLTTSAYAGPPIDITKLEGEWIVQRIDGTPSLVVAAATAQSENGNLLISIEGACPFSFTTMSVRPKGNVLEGTVKLSDSDLGEHDPKIRIKVDGAIMEAADPVSRNLVLWVFQRPAVHR